jgi:arylsulfatase A-like enzyme
LGLTQLVCIVTRMTFKMHPRLTVLLVIFLGAISLIAYGVWKYLSNQSPVKARNIAMLVIDTLRADHLGCYGYGRPVSPNVDELAKKSTRYSRSFSSSPWTLPSHASLFTGLFPYEHGAHTYLLEKPTYKKRKDGSKRKIPTGTYKLKDKYFTLAEFLSQSGYATGAVAANVSFLSKRLNLHQGFDHYHVTFKRANKLNDLAFEWIDEVRNNNRGFFMFINYMDTHRPYNTTPRPGLFKEPVIRDSNRLLDELKAEVLGTHKDPVFPPKLAKQVIAQYDTAIANIDEEIGRFITFLKSRKLYDNTLIVITSDHGEYFGEHFLVEHSKDVYQEALYVPLIVKGLYQREGSVSRDVISSVDLPGLIVRHLEQSVAPQGPRLFKRVPGNHPIVAENYFSRASDIANSKWGKRFRRMRATLLEWPYKYVLSSDGNHEMYHLNKDSKETTNLVEIESERAEKYRKRVSRWVKPNWAKNKPPSGDALSETEIEQMRALGYVE